MSFSNILLIEVFQCEIISLILRYSRENETNSEKKPKSAPEEKMLWNIPFHLRKAFLREKLSLKEFLMIFGFDNKTKIRSHLPPLKITIPNEFDLKNDKNQQIFYKFYLKQLLREKEKEDNMCRYYPFEAKPLPRSNFGDLYQKQQQNLQDKRDLWTKRSFIKRRRKN